MRYIQAIKKVSLQKEKDKFFLTIEFHDNLSFVPRIHTMANGIKIIICCNRKIAQPKSLKISNKILKGCFFEKFGEKSLMFIAALNDKAEFFEKKYTKNSIKIGFKQLYKPTIIIDAGHGGADSGTSSVSGDFEKNINLLFAIELRNYLLKTAKYKVILTRDSDETINHPDRIKKIISNKGDLMISIHTDYNMDKNLRGMSIYTRPNMKDYKAFSTIVDDKEKKIMFKKYQKILRHSQRFAKNIVKYIPSFCKINKNPCRNNEFKILKTDVPSVLMELGCVSNKIDNELLHNIKFRKKTCNAIIYAVNEFFEKDKR